MKELMAKQTAAVAVSLDDKRQCQLSYLHGLTQAGCEKHTGVLQLAKLAGIAVDTICLTV